MSRTCDLAQCRPQSVTPQTMRRARAGFATGATVIAAKIGGCSGSSATLVGRFDVGYPVTGSLDHPGRAGAKAPDALRSRVGDHPGPAATDPVVLRAPTCPGRT